MNLFSVGGNYFGKVDYCQNTRKQSFKGKTQTEQTDPIATSKNEPAILNVGEEARGAINKYLLLKEYGKDEGAIETLNGAVEKLGAESVERAAENICASLYSQGETRVARKLTDDVLKSTGAKPQSDLPEKMVPVKESIKELQEKLAELQESPESETKSAEIEEVQKQLDGHLAEVKEEISSLQKQLKAYGAGTDRYDQIEMDKIQASIKALREIVPIDRTNLEEVLMASPEEIFQPLKADNIKGKGITFKPVIPEDPEELKKVTYKTVPIYTNARTVEEMIRLANRDGVKIELVKDDKGNYYPAVKSIWSEGGYFKLDRDSYVIQYGEIPADDPYIDHEWAEKNKYLNKDGQYVVMDCAIVASDKKTVADIMPHSYVKADGSPITNRDRYAWDGFEVHKDPDGVVNAVAYEEPKTFTTLEGPIETDVTMGDVEGNVYNKYNDLKKQIIKHKIQANPDDPNSQKFIDLVLAGDDDAAIALLRKATKD